MALIRVMRRSGKHGQLSPSPILGGEGDSQNRPLQRNGFASFMPYIGINCFLPLQLNSVTNNIDRLRRFVGHVQQNV